MKIEFTATIFEIRCFRKWNSFTAVLRLFLVVTLIIAVRPAEAHPTKTPGQPNPAPRIDTDGSASDGSPPYDGKKLLLVMLDGFRWDYVDKYGDLLGFNLLRKKGVYAEYCDPVFPSTTLPNMYSVATGRYPENHGILDDFMYDQHNNTIFQLGPLNTEVNGPWWEEAEPLWITATKAGLRAHMYLWGGCDVTIFGLRPAYCTSYHESPGVFEFRANIYDVIDKFEKNEADLGMIYVENPDLVAHVFGPETKMMELAARDTDSVIQTMIRRIEQKGLQDKINVIVMSDHGITATDRKSVEKLRLSDYIDVENDVQVILSSGAMTNILSKTNRTNKIYNDLKSIGGLHVWLADEIPENLHYKHSKLILDILVVAKRGYGIAPWYCCVYVAGRQMPYESLHLPLDLIEGIHGYLAEDFPDMRGIFYAWGPDMMNNYMAPKMRTIDVYNLASHLLGITPLPNNGSWDAVKVMLKSNEHANSNGYQISGNVALLALLLICWTLV